MRAIIIANGTFRSGVAVRQRIRDLQDSHIIAVDGGANIAQQIPLPVHTLIGDMDSITAEILTQYEEEKSVQILRYPHNKDETDLELALRWAAEQDLQTIDILAAVGDRFDHTTANLHLLAQDQLRNLNIHLLDGDQDIIVRHPGKYSITGKKGDTVSLIPLAGDVLDVTTDGLQYPLQNETLDFSLARGVSNILVQDLATINFRHGILLIVHHMQEPN